MKKLMLVLAAIALPMAAHAAPCKDAKGKFIRAVFDRFESTWDSRRA
jgi:hypothetical protein